MKRISLFIPENFLKALGKLAKKRSTTASQLIRDSVYQFLKAAGALCLLLAIGCGGGSTGGGTSYPERISDWQSREAVSESIDIPCNITGDPHADVRSLIYSLPRIEYKSDDGDSWQTSTETMELGTGDCEDMAILAYRALCDSALVEYYDMDVRVRIVRESEFVLPHAVAIIYFPDNTTMEINLMRVNDREGDEAITTEFDIHTIYS